MIIPVKFAEITQEIGVEFVEITRKFKAHLGEIHPVTEYVGGERYEGEYDITPKVEAQTLPTAKKVLERDVNINAIPYAEVQNNSNGKTVMIG